MKRFILSILALGILISFSGCGSKQFQYVHNKNIKVGYEILHAPKLNTIVTREIGSNMYEKKHQISHDTYDVYINESISEMYSQASGLFAKDKGYIGTLSIDKATQWKSVCTISDAKYSLEVCLFDSNSDGKFDKVASKRNTLYADLNTPVTYIMKQKKPTYSEDSFKYTALYQGKTSDKIKISFMEFKNNMARPAFTQNIEYELENNGTAIIGFKGLRIKVLKATNLDITYKVIHDYN